jgi:hypothetical protein
MNRIILISLLFALFSCVQKKPEGNSESKHYKTNNKQLTQIEFDTEMHDFGRVKSGEILTYSFVFSNRGETGLTIGKAEADCGCIKATIPTEPVKPGEKGFIEVEFNSSGMFGKQLKTIEIQSNSKEPKHLIIFAEVENELFEIKN